MFERFITIWRRYTLHLMIKKLPINDYKLEKLIKITDLF